MELTQSVQDIADVIGRERALYLIGRLPTTRVESRGYNKVLCYVPKRLTLDHLLTQILGWQDASKLVSVFGGELIQVSNCEYIYKAFLKQSIQALHEAGMSNKQIEVTFGISDRERRRTVKPKKDIQAANDNNRASNKPHKATA